MSENTEYKIGFIDWLKSRRTEVGAIMASTALTLTVACTPAAVDGSAEAPSPSSSADNSLPSPSTKGECEPFELRGQNFIDPIGAAIRAEPSTNSAKAAGIGGNEAVSVVGWTRSEAAAYPENPAPWDGHVWYEVNNAAGLYKDGGDNVVWVNFAGVRDGYSSYKQSNGKQAPTPSDCEIVE